MAARAKTDKGQLMHTSDVQPKVAIIYYSSTGTVHAMAEAVREGAEKAGAVTRLRRVPELASPGSIAKNPAWAAHAAATAEVPLAVNDDLVWADAVIFGTPTRYGLPAAQLKQFVDRTGQLWDAGLLADKLYASFTSTDTPHGGQESTIIALHNVIYHWGGLIVPPGYTGPQAFEVGNPYGPSHVSGDGPPGEVVLEEAAYLGQRLTHFAALLLAGARHLPHLQSGARHVLSG